MGKKLKILICPLNWGIGHATRSAAIIEKLMELGHDITIASDGNAMMVLKRQFPTLKNRELAHLNIRYSKYFFFGMAMQSLKIANWMQKDRRKLKNILSDEPYDVIISDSRPAIYSTQIKSILIINQTTPILPWYGGAAIIKLILNRIYKKYHEIWIPDIFGENSLSGKLTKITNHNHVRYIGWLSRLKISKKAEEIPDKVLAVISGPEPSRSKFKQLLDLKLADQGAMVIGGDVNGEENNTNYIPYLEENALASHIESAEYIISRGGYSSLMDLAFANKKLILVPTPGQTEQEYLAMRWTNKNYAVIWDLNKENWKEVKLKSDRVMRFDLEKLNMDNDRLLEDAMNENKLGKINHLVQNKK